MESKARAEETLASALAMQPKHGTTGDFKANYLVAKNVLDEEMGRQGEYMPSTRRPLSLPRFVHRLAAIQWSLRFREFRVVHHR
jgi:hypothetical protein